MMLQYFSPPEVVCCKAFRPFTSRSSREQSAESEQLMICVGDAVLVSLLRFFKHPFRLFGSEIKQ